MSSSGSVIRRRRRSHHRLRKPFPLPISCPKFAQVPSSLPFSSQRAHSNTHLAISLTSSPFRRRSGEVKDSPTILHSFILCDPFAVQIWREISSQNLPIRPSFLSGTFLSIFHCQIDSSGRGIILEAPKFRSHHQFAAAMASKGDNRCLIYTLIPPLPKSPPPPSPRPIHP